MVKNIGIIMAALMIAALGNGCVTTYGSQRMEEEARAREDFLLLQEDLRKLSGRIEGIELEVERLRRDVDMARSEQPRATQSQLQAVEAGLADLDRKLRALDARNAKEKQEIIDKLSAKVAQVVGGSSSASRSKPAKRNVSSEGYEHVVQPGETLSAIAAAYNSRSADIIEANGLDNPNALRAGQTLFIPAP